MARKVTNYNYLSEEVNIINNLEFVYQMQQTRVSLVAAITERKGDAEIHKRFNKMKETYKLFQMAHFK